MTKVEYNSLYWCWIWMRWSASTAGGFWYLAAEPAVILVWTFILSRTKFLQRKQFWRFFDYLKTVKLVLCACLCKSLRKRTRRGKAKGAKGNGKRYDGVSKLCKKNTVLNFLRKPKNRKVAFLRFDCVPWKFPPSMSAQGHKNKPLFTWNF